MNWGYKIMFVFLGFATFILYLVSRSFNENIDLVSADYYEQEIAYDKQINKIRNSNNLKSKVKFSQDDNHVIVEFPKEITRENVNGTIHLFRPSDASLDKKIPIAIDEKNAQSLSKDDLPTGMYRVKINLTAGNKNYFFEEVIFV